MECGIGARIDATNVIDTSDLLCSVITSIGLDHMDVLGDTEELIATEKAFVIKQNVKTVIGPSCTQKSIKDRALEVGGELIEVAK